MNEYIIYNAVLDIEKPIFGYSFRNACERYGIDPKEWKLVHVYISRDEGA